MRLALDEERSLVIATEGDAFTRLFLLRIDLEGLEIALEDFETARDVLDAAFRAPDWGPDEQRRRNQAHRRLFHSAKVFVCGMRRFARLLEATKGRGDD